MAYGFTRSEVVNALEINNDDVAVSLRYLDEVKVWLFIGRFRKHRKFTGK